VARSDGFQIQFERSGGLAGTSVRTIVDSARIADSDANELRGLIDRADFAVPARPPRGADRFQYDIKLHRGGMSQSITAYDGSMAPELKALTDWLLAYARRPKAV